MAREGPSRRSRPRSPGGVPSAARRRREARGPPPPRVPPPARAPRPSSCEDLEVRGSCGVRVARAVLDVDPEHVPAGPELRGSAPEHGDGAFVIELSARDESTVRVDQDPSTFIRFDDDLDRLLELDDARLDAYELGIGRCGVDANRVRDEDGTVRALEAEENLVRAVRNDCPRVVSAVPAEDEATLRLPPADQQRAHLVAVGGDDGGVDG